MCKGLFKVKSERKIKGVDVISYFKQQSVLAKGIAVCFAIFILASCGKNTDDSMFQTSKNAADAYRSYLSEVRKEANLPTDRLIEKSTTGSRFGIRYLPVSPKTRQIVFTPITKAKFVDCTIRCALNLPVWLWRSRELLRMCCSSENRLPNTGKTRS